MRDEPFAPIPFATGEQIFLAHLQQFQHFLDVSEPETFGFGARLGITTLTETDGDIERRYMVSIGSSVWFRSKSRSALVRVWRSPQLFAIAAVTLAKPPL